MKRLCTLILAVSLAVFTQAQDYSIGMQVVASAGGYYNSTEAGVSISWTLGEVAYTTLTAGGYMLTQGFQQGNLFTTDVEKPELSGSDMKIYPNPASVEFFIKINSPTAKGKSTAEVYDITGRKVITKELNLEENEPYRIPIAELKAGIYMIRITVESSKAVKVFKLIKE
ncbi:MAG TPA: T9SS type A sorting domain-containing protein [Tenuifilaceae bacterium]|nr:T9SS type A sorting domain-containing protein [Tenuifilaceae bacterium]HPI44600.1 T9SS type A sorting domain-containing protein [Tenuifilaceae bacterium]HPN22060.1 T9SS type A sorting domain-containing protein [Tenuifilaceae bacterium]